MEALIAVVAFVALMGLFTYRRFPHLFAKPVIQDPKIGFLNLLGEEGDQLLEQDRPALAPLFSTVRESRDLPPPACDVLVVYTDLGYDGNLFATEVGLRYLLRKSGARILIVASENKGENSIVAAQEAGHSRANLVLTLGRKDGAFPAFFSRLFTQMKAGTPMPEAWSQLAPQTPEQERETPGTIFLAEGGPIAFGGRVG
jgi:hypothetical protein